VFLHLSINGHKVTAVFLNLASSKDYRRQDLSIICFFSNVNLSYHAYNMLYI